jgi:hypothetical protein
MPFVQIVQPLGPPLHLPPPPDPLAVKHARVLHIQFRSVKPYFTGSAYIVRLLTDPIFLDRIPDPDPFEK